MLCFVLARIHDEYVCVARRAIVKLSRKKNRRNECDAHTIRHEEPYNNSTLLQATSHFTLEQPNFIWTQNSSKLHASTDRQTNRQRRQQQKTQQRHTHTTPTQHTDDEDEGRQRTTTANRQPTDRQTNSQCRAPSLIQEKCSPTALISLTLN